MGETTENLGKFKQSRFHCQKNQLILDLLSLLFGFARLQDMLLHSRTSSVLFENVVGQSRAVL